MLFDQLLIRLRMQPDFVTSIAIFAFMLCLRTLHLPEELWADTIRPLMPDLESRSYPFIVRSVELRGRDLLERAEIALQDVFVVESSEAAGEVVRHDLLEEFEACVDVDVECSSRAGHCF